MKQRHLCHICLAVIFLWCIPLAGLHPGRADPSAVPRPYREGAHIRASGTVYRQEYSSTSQQIYLRDLSLENLTARSGPDTTQTNTERILVYMEKEQKVDLGDRLLIEGVCAYPRARTNPGAFDSAAYYQSQGIGMFLKKGVLLGRQKHRWLLRDGLADLRLYLQECLKKAGEDTDAGLLGAMLLGSRRGLDERLRDLYQDAGLIHLLAISGLHLSLTGMALYHLLRRIRLGFGASAAVSGALVLAYVYMAGCPISAVRAAAMFGLFLLSQVTGRTSDLPTSLAVTAAAVLIVRGETVYQSGFWLSFAAVLGLAASALWQSRLFRNTPLGTSLAVQFALAPLLARFYGQLPSYSVLLNLLAIPLMPVVLASGIAGMAGAACSAQLGRFLLAPAHYLLALLSYLCGKVRLLPYAQMVTGQPRLWRIAGYYLLLAVYLWFQGRKKQKRGNPLRRDGKLLLAAAALFVLLCQNRTRGFTVTFLDVGQGDGCCVENAGRSVWMVDGGSSSEGELARYCLEPFLKSRGRDRVDYWLISHGDGDHLSGLLETLQTYEQTWDGRNAAGLCVGTILLPDVPPNEELRELQELAGRQNIAVRMVKKGDVIRDGAMTVKILAPEKGAVYESENAASVVAQISYKDTSFLFTGDLEGDGEEMLLQKELLTKTDILKAAHHGSRGATSAAFLQKTRPSVTVISCGRNNNPTTKMIQA